jgi:NAD(P)-dependent dehydrogenase (short-subunit alcohol dehydrogenase family)
MGDIMKDKICLITGANTGIGKEIATGLAALGATVLMICRNKKGGLTAKDEIQKKTGSEDLHLFFADLSIQQEIRRLVKEIQAEFKSLNVIINNASLLSHKQIFTPEGFESQLSVNYLAYYLLTRLLLPQLENGAPARVINVASSAHFRATLDLDFLKKYRTFSPPHIYSKTKLADIFFTYEFARRLDNKNVTFNACHPGVVATNLLADYLMLPRFSKFFLRLFSVSPERGALTPLFLAASPQVVSITGKYFVKQVEHRSSKSSYDINTAKKLWNISAAFTGMSKDI